MEIFVLRDGQQIGPFSEETVQSQLKRGGLLSADMAWRKGLPGWIPLREILDPGSSGPPPAPEGSGVRNGASGISKKPATAKQRALLKYIGATFDEDITHAEAAVAISQAIESPKLTARFTKWGEEKLRLHPELFQDEMDYRRSNRVVRYLELCQTEAAAVVKDVTKAHAQVIIESLDKKNPSWEMDSHAALWDYMLPTIAEHFPQLVREEWKGKLKLGGKSKIAVSHEGSHAGVLDAEPPPDAIQAAIRGILYGVAVLVVAFGAYYLYMATKPAAKSVVSAPAAQNPSEGLPPLPPLPPQAEAPPVVVNPVIAPPPNGEVPNNPIPVLPPLIVEANPAPQNPVPAVPMAEKPPGENPAVPALPPVALLPPAVIPALPPAVASGLPPPVPSEPAPAPVPGAKSLLTLTKSVAVQLQFGRVTLNAGTRVRFIAVEGQNVRVNFNNNVILVPTAATDLDPNALPPASATAPAPAIAPATPPATIPAIPPTPKPSSDL